MNRHMIRATLAVAFALDVAGAAVAMLVFALPLAILSDVFSNLARLCSAGQTLAQNWARWHVDAPALPHREDR